MEFRFRAKSPESKRWLYFGIFNVPSWITKDRRDEVQQYIGLEDKAGTPIFEGDIVSTDLSRPFLIVEFRNGAFMFQCHHNGQDYYDHIEPAWENLKTKTKYHEVIGNIYDNPELLEHAQ